MNVVRNRVLAWALALLAGYGAYVVIGKVKNPWSPELALGGVTAPKPAATAASALWLPGCATHPKDCGK